MSPLATKDRLSTKYRSAAPIGTLARRSHRAPEDSGLRVSFEFFPPKTAKAATRLWDTLSVLEPLQPDFVSVTYGAGGSTRERTLDTVKRMVAETSLRPAAHLTCVDASRMDVDEVADELWEAGVRHVVALRGDPSSGIGTAYQPQADGYPYASDLVRGLMDRHGFEVSVSAYPERHPESADWNAELDNLRRKVDAGASRAITQFFFSPETFLRFQDRVADAGIELPIVPGLMLQPNFEGLARMSRLCGVEVPDWYAGLFDGLEEDPGTRELLTASLISDLTAELHAHGVRDFHLYTLNSARIAASVSRLLGLHHRAALAA